MFMHENAFEMSSAHLAAILSLPQRVNSLRPGDTYTHISGLSHHYFILCLFLNVWYHAIA